MAGQRLIITADDYGLTDATSRAIIEVHERGVVTATSVLAVAPGVGERLSWLEGSPELSVGVHLALVGEDPPLLSAGEIPSLVDGRGAFRRSWRHLVPLLALGRVDPDDVRRELSAQIAVVAEHCQPTHLDTHQHLHLWPSVAKVVVELAVSSGVLAVRVPRSASAGPRGVAVNALAARLAERVAAAGLRCTEHFRGLDEAGSWTASSLEVALGDLARAGGSAELNVHPGAVVDGDRARFDWGYGWAAERAALLDPSIRRTIERLGFELVGR